MLRNFVEATSSTGGTGALTLTDVTGSPNFNDTGLFTGQLVSYSIVEYTDSTRAVVAKAEIGYGAYSSTGPTLTRSLPRTTWTGTVVDETSPTALSFGTTADNIRVRISPSAGHGSLGIPKCSDGSNSSIGGPFTGANFMVETGTTFTAIVGRVVFVPFQAVFDFEVKSIGVEITTPVASSLFSVGIFTIDPGSGHPGQLLFAGNDLSGAASGTITGTVSAYLSPGWYWAGFQSDSAIVVRGTNTVHNPFMGLQSGRHVRYMFDGATYTTFASSNYTTSVLVGSWSQVNNTATPLILLGDT